MSTVPMIDMDRKALQGRRPSEVALFPSLPSSKCIISARSRAGSQGFPTLRKGCASQLPLLPPAPSPNLLPLPPCLPLTFVMLRPELLLDLIRGRPVSTQLSSAQWHGAVLTLPLCVQVQKCPLGGRQRPCLEWEQGWQSGPLLHSAAAASKAGVQVAGRLCARAVGWGGAARVAGGHEPPGVQPLPVGGRTWPGQKVQSLGSLQGRVLL